MSTRIAINGFGRIGRTSFKVIFDKIDDLEIVAINDLTDTKTLAHLLKHDTNYGLYEADVKFDEKNLIINGKKIAVLAEKDPTKLSWGKLGVEIVLECTGRFTDFAGASGHIKAGAKRVIISAPAKGDYAPTHVLGVNSDNMGEDEVINNASCTTNCIAPVAAIMHSKFGVKRALMTTVHGYTADQNLQDGPHKDLRRARAAAANIVPTTTGAALAVTEVIPELQGLFDGLAIRVPVTTVSLSDCTFLLERQTTVEEINQAFIEAAKTNYKGILDVTNEPLVSSDFVRNPHSAIVDLALTKVVGGDFVKVVAWYDNEWGYSNRLAEMAQLIAKKL